MAVTRLLAPSADIAALRAALDTASGYPYRSKVVGAPDAVPAIYAPGAPGWTTSSGAPIVSLGDGYSTLEVSEYAQQFMGTTVGEISIPAFGEQPLLMLAGQSNARDAIVPSLSADGYLFARVAQGGTGLQAGWENGGALFQSTVSACYGHRVAFCWIQGERDANNLTWAQEYRDRFEALYAAFAAQIDLECFVVALLNSNCQYPHTALVRQAQIDFCAADPTMRIAFDMDQFTQHYNGLHYVEAGNIAIGSGITSTAIAA